MIKHKKIFLSHCLLFLIAILEIISIIPAGDAYALGNINDVGFIISYIYVLLIIPTDCLFTSFTGDYWYMQNQRYPMSIIISSLILSLIIWLIILRFAKNRKMILDVLLPYLFVSVLLSIYTWAHHFGIFYIYLIGILWKMQDQSPILANEIIYPVYISCIFCVS